MESGGGLDRERPSASGGSVEPIAVSLRAGSMAAWSGRAYSFVRWAFSVRGLRPPARHYKKEEKS